MTDLTPSMRAKAEAVESVLWFRRTRLNYVCVYNREPLLTDGGWSERGFVHDWSPNDALVLDFLACLEKEMPRRVLFSTVVTGRWRFVRVPAEDYPGLDDDVHMFMESRFIQPFCGKFFKAARVPDLPRHVPLYITFLPE